MYILLIAPLDESVVTSSSLTSPANRFWKWGPLLLLALIYAFARFRRAVNISILHLHWRSADPSSSSTQLLTADGEFFSSDDEDGDGEDEVSCASEEEEEAELRDDLASTSCDNLAGFYDDRSEKKRKFRIRRKRSINGGNVFSLGDLVNGKSVVRFWDGLGLGLGLDCASPSFSSVSIFDLERDVKIGAFPGRIPEVLAQSAVVFTASDGGDGKVGVSSWDVRVRRRAPAVKAEWSLRAAGPAVGVKTGGVEKVYVRDDVSGNGKVWDVRNAKSPLENVTWWDDNAVSQTEDE